MGEQNHLVDIYVRGQYFFVEIGGVCVYNKSSATGILSISLKDSDLERVVKMINPP